MVWHAGYAVVPRVAGAALGAAHCVLLRQSHLQGKLSYPYNVCEQCCCMRQGAASVTGAPPHPPL